MPYKDKAKQREYSNQWYSRNSERVIDRKRRRIAESRKRLDSILPNWRKVFGSAAADGLERSVSRVQQHMRLQKYNEEVFAYPRGRICLIERCSDCLRFCLGVTSGRERTKYGAVDYSVPKRVIGSWDDGICDECRGNAELFEEIARCECCGVFKKKSATGVDDRWKCRTSEDGHGSRLLCVSCWNRARHVFRRLNEAEDTRLFLNRVKKEISSVCKNQQMWPNARVSDEHDGRLEGW